MTDFLRLPTFSPKGEVHVVVECPRAARAKFKYQPSLCAFVLNRLLRDGVTYPYDWGFVPSTKAEDDDPLDGLILHDLTSFSGAIVCCRAAALLKVCQREEGEEFRNDRVIFVPSSLPDGADGALLSEGRKSQLEDFFRAAIRGTSKEIEFLGWQDAEAAMSTIHRAANAFQGQN